MPSSREKIRFFQTFIEDIFLVRKRQKRFLDKKTYFSDSLWQTFISNRLKSEKVESHFLSILKVLGASFFSASAISPTEVLHQSKLYQLDRWEHIMIVKVYFGNLFVRKISDVVPHCGT